MKIGIALFIVLIVGASAIAMAAGPGTPGNEDVIGPGPRAELEDNKVILIKFDPGMEYSINLTGSDSLTETYSGSITDIGKGKMFSVMFVNDSSSNPTGDSHIVDLGTYDAEVYVLDSEGIRILQNTGEIIVADEDDHEDEH